MKSPSHAGKWNQKQQTKHFGRFLEGKKNVENHVCITARIPRKIYMKPGRWWFVDACPYLGGNLFIFHVGCQESTCWTLPYIVLYNIARIHFAEESQAKIIALEDQWLSPLARNPMLKTNVTHGRCKVLAGGCWRGSLSCEHVIAKIMFGYIVWFLLDQILFRGVSDDHFWIFWIFDHRRAEMKNIPWNLATLGCLTGPNLILFVCTGQTSGPVGQTSGPVGSLMTSLR